MCRKFLHVVIWYQVFRCNAKDLHTVAWFHRQGSSFRWVRYLYKNRFCLAAFCLLKTFFSVPVDSFMKTTESFTNIYFLLQSRHEISENFVQDSIWLLLYLLLIKLIIICEELVIILIARLFRSFLCFFDNVCGLIFWVEWYINVMFYYLKNYCSEFLENICVYKFWELLFWRVVWKI